MIRANIITDIDPMISNSVGPEDYLIKTDADFKKLETIVKLYGKRCYIQWSRDTDSQIAYWGPSGATIKPYAYNI